MSYNTKRILAILLAVIILFGWYITLIGIGPVGPIKNHIKLGLDIEGGVYVVMEAQTDKTGQELTMLMEQTQAVIENRVNQLGLSEPVVTIEGEKRIRIELPGVEDSNAAIEVIGKTAQLQFVMADGRVVLDGSMVKDAGVTQDNEHGGSAISLQFNKEGTEAFAQATREAYSGQVVSTIPGVSNRCIIIMLDGEMISAPVVQTPIENGQAIISSSQPGGYAQKDASRQAALIRGGALPVELTEVMTSTRTATIGVGALQKSIEAGFIALILIYLIMFLGYRIMGLAANIALTLYVLIVLWVMVLFDAVLTLPGIAGIILSIGMAVDANVIIFARIREEICNGKTVRVAIQSGFKRAMSTVIDSHTTTIIAAVVLFQVGTSSVKGFAMTLMIGIVTSLLTAVVVTHLYLSLMGDGKKTSAKWFYGVKEDNTPALRIKKEIRFMKYRKIYYIVSIAIIVIGLLVGAVRGYNYGIDFTGGTMIQIDMGKQVSHMEVDNLLKKHDIEAEVIFGGSNNEEVMIRTIQSLDNEERFALINDMKTNFGITDQSILAIEQFGPSVSKELRSNAVKAVVVSSIFMLIYIIIRFEWKFGIASILGVVHDILLVICFYAIFQVTINNPFIAGILTVVGYSINDTIVIFDRIRENLGIMKKTQVEELIDKSINQTLIRSLMTSFTTIVVMIPLLIMTSDTIKEFILPLMVGVLVGAASSITLCSPVYYELCKVTGGPRYRAKKSKKADASRRGDRQAEEEV